LFELGDFAAYLLRDRCKNPVLRVQKQSRPWIVFKGTDEIVKLTS